MKTETTVLDRIESEMKRTFGADVRRIAHALSVYGFARQILAHEPGDAVVVGAAALLHDIGIQAAERKHGSSAGKYQEIEGPPLAQPILEAAGFSADDTRHVCRIVGSHHSARDIDTPEFRAIWDADWLVNIPEECVQMNAAERSAFIRRVFKTPTGLAMALVRYG